MEKHEIEEIVRQSRVCRLAMIDGNRPHMVPMNFGYADNTLYFHSSPKSRKLELLRTNPNVCVEFDAISGIKESDEPCRWSIEGRSVIGFGKAVAVEKLEEKIEALNIIMVQYSDRRYQFPEKELNVTAVFKVKLESLTGKAKG